jgi:D-alanyl-D-alanine carboxypeptidase (penicillin-binding protein 5/6)
MSPFRFAAVAAIAAASVWPSPAAAAPAHPRAKSSARAPAPAPAPAAAAPATAPTTAPVIAAAAYLLLDFASGTPLVAQNADERRDPASLTKLMTAYVAYAPGRQAHAVADGDGFAGRMARRGPRMFIEPRRAVRSTSFCMAVVQSATTRRSRSPRPSPAANPRSSLMNAEAGDGAAGTHFTNATAAAGDHFPTARDLAVLAAAIIRDYPDHYSLYSLKEIATTTSRSRTATVCCGLIPTWTG